VRLDGKTALVIGDIGLATPQAFSRQGATPAITGRNRRPLHDAVPALTGAPIHRERRIHRR
jgi:hypothetical protein